IDDVLALRPDALVCRRTMLVTDRATGGPFEQEGIALWHFGDDGRATRLERFDVDQDDEALSRFDELAAGASARDPAGRPAAGLVPRRTRPNAVTAHLARFDAAFASRDVDAIADLLADTSEFVHHPSGVTYDRRDGMSQWRKGLRSEDPVMRH